MNLLKETISKLMHHKKSPKDVKWVGCKEFKTSWENFAIVADVEYDNGFGGAEVADDLLVVGKDFWLERHEYDGSEWWEFKSLPVEPVETKEIYAVMRSQILGEWDWHNTLSGYNGYE